MKNKIHKYMVLISVMSIILTTLLISVVYYNSYEKKVMRELQDEAVLLQDYLVENDYDINKITIVPSSRVTLINSNGDVLFDNYSDKDVMDNHSNREEVAEAISNGEGVSKRYSETLTVETYYYALKISEDLIIRVSRFGDSIFKFFSDGIIIIVFIVLFLIIGTYSISKALVKNIVSPITKLSFDELDIPVYDEFKPYVAKIKYQKRKLEEKIEEVEYRNETIDTILKSMQEGLVIVDNQKKIISTNEQVSRIFGKRVNDLVSRNILEVFRDIEFIESLKEALEGNNVSFNFKQNDSIYEVITSPVVANGVIGGALILFVNITEKASSEEIRRQFSANVSHELKTPLTTILGISELIEYNMVKADDTPEFAGKIKAEAKRLINLVEDIIFISMLDEKNKFDNFEIFDVNTLIKSVIEELGGYAKSKNVELQQYSYGKCEYYGNKELIEVLLRNLINNSIKYNKENGTVIASAQNIDKKCILKVSDTGIGMESNELSRIFERFYVVDKSRSKKSGGTGLGLSIVKHIVKFHNSEINVESKVGEGTVFTAKLQ